MLDLKSWELARYNVDDTPTQAALDALADTVRKLDGETAPPSVGALLAQLAKARAGAVVPITFEVKRLNRKQAQVHQRTFAAAMKAEIDKLREAEIDPGGQGDDETLGAAMVRDLHAKATMEVAGLDFYETIGDAYIRQCFEQFTRNWTGVTLDGAPVTDGKTIADWADNALVRFVLTEIRRVSQLSVMEGNASASPSGLAQEAGTTTGDSISTAPSTESVTGTAA